MFKFRKTLVGKSLVEYFAYDFGEYFFVGHFPQWQGSLRDKLIPADRRANAKLSDFESLIGNRHPSDTLRKIRRNDSKVASYELCCSAPKAVSILGALFAANGDWRIHQIHSSAVSEVLSFLETKTDTRVRKNKSDDLRRTGNFIALKVCHGIARPTMDANGIVHGGDPNIHEHVIIPNITYDEEEKTYKAINLKALTMQLELATAIYRNILARRLREIGISISFKNKVPQVDAISPEICKAYSKRGQQIDELAANEEKFKSVSNVAALKDKIAITSRLSKDKYENEETAYWRIAKGLNACGITVELTQKSKGFLQKFKHTPTVSEAVDCAVNKCFSSERNSIKTDAFFAAALNAAEGYSSFEEIKSELNERIKEKKLKNDGHYIYTTEHARIKNGLLGKLGDIAAPIANTPLIGKVPHKLAFNETNLSRIVTAIETSDKKVFCVQNTDKKETLRAMRSLDTRLKLRGMPLTLVYPNFAVKKMLSGFSDTRPLREVCKSCPRNGIVALCESQIASSDDMSALLESASNAKSRVILLAGKRRYKSASDIDALRIMKDSGKLAAINANRKPSASELLVKNGDYIHAFSQIHKACPIIQTRDILNPMKDYILKNLRRDVAVVVPDEGDATYVNTHVVRSPLLKNCQTMTTLNAVGLYEVLCEDTRKGKAYLKTKGISNVPDGIYKVLSAKKQNFVVSDKDGYKYEINSFQKDKVTFYEETQTPVYPGERIRFLAEYKSADVKIRSGEYRKIWATKQNGNVVTTDGEEISQDFKGITLGLAVTPKEIGSLKCEEALFVHSRAHKTTKEEFTNVISCAENVSVVSDSLDVLFEAMGIKKSYITRLLEFILGIGKKKPAPESPSNPHNTPEIKPTTPPDMPHDGIDYEM